MQAAKEAAPAWGRTPPLKRARYMFRFKELLDKHAADIARAISREHGKTHADALGEVARGIEVVEFACGIPHLLKGEFSRNVGPEIDTHSDRQPLGVVAGITPFNFPAMVPLWMYPVAIACGNTFILKPSERDPSAPMLVFELFKRGRLPRRRAQRRARRQGSGRRHPRPPRHQGRELRRLDADRRTTSTRAAPRAGKRVQALGGAKNHMIVMPDADMDKAADALMGAGYGSAGERCMAISVAVPVGEETANRLVETLAPKVRALKIGPATDPDAEMGPLVTEAAHARRCSATSTQGVEGRRRTRRRRPRLQAAGLRGRLSSWAARCSTASRRT